MQTVKIYNIMVKKVFVAAFAVLMGMNLMAQSVQETTAMVGSLTVPAYTMTLEKEAKTVQEAVAQRFKDAKLKTKNVDGYTAVLEQMMPEIATVPVSVYVKVEEQGKRKNRTTLVTVCALTTDLTIDQSLMRNNVRSYLEGLPVYIGKYEASQNMQAEQKNLKQAEKAAAAAVSALTDLEKDIASDQKKIADKRNEIAKLQGKIKDLEKDIKELEARIEKNTGKKSDAEKRVSDTQESVNAKQGEVERYRELSK